MRVSLPLLNYLPGVYQGGVGGPQASRVTFGLNLAWSPLTLYRDPAFSAPLSRQRFGESWLQTDTRRTLDNVGNRSERGVLERGRVKRIWPSSTMAPALLCRRGNNWGKVEDTDTACGTQLAWTHRHSCVAHKLLFNLNFLIFLRPKGRNSLLAISPFTSTSIREWMRNRALLMQPVPGCKRNFFLHLPRCSIFKLPWSIMHPPKLLLCDQPWIIW